MVHTTCVVRDCMSSSYINKELRFHQFPRTDERCKLWLKACRRPDLDGRTFESLKNTYVCSLHFEKDMYGKKSLKKTAIPTLLLPTKDSIHTQTDTEICEVTLYLPSKGRILKPKIAERDHELPGPSSHIAEHTYSKQDICSDCISQTPARLTNHTLRKRKLRNQLLKTKKKLKYTAEKYDDVSEIQFLKSCDRFLSPKLSAIVKVQMCLQPH